MLPPRFAGALTAPLCALLLLAVGCDSGGAGDPDPADTAVPTKAGLGLDYSQTTGGAVALYDPADATFAGAPWPSDRHLGADGPDLVGSFPNPKGVGLLTTYINYGQSAVDGFSRNAAIYFRLSAPLADAALPTDAETLTDPAAHIQLVDLTDGAVDYGRRFPLALAQRDGANDPYYPGQTLVMRAVYGFPLADAHTYCAVVTRAVTDADGNYLERAPAFEDALTNEPTLAPLRGWLAGDATPLAAVDVASATCFTTQDATGEMRRIQGFIEQSPTTALYDLEYSGMTQCFHQVVGKYRAPNFQEGDKPYASTGGDVKFDAAGAPIVQADEEIRVRVLLPACATMPDTGWPVVLYSHGTGGNWNSCLDATGNLVMREGLAMVCIDQPLHGGRGVGDDDNFLNSFNYLNPQAGRMSFRQAASDTVWLTKMLADGRFDLDEAASGMPGGFTMDPEGIVFFGHSHGGLAGILILGVDPRVKGAVLSGSSGVLAETILRRKDIVDIQALVAQAAGIEAAQLDTFHPVTTLAQTLVDATDPINYAPYWLEPVTGGRSKHVFMTSGTDDAASPSVGADAVAAAAGVPLIEPVAQSSRAHELRGLVPARMPVNSNLASTTGDLITAGLRQFPAGDHFVAFEDEATALWRGFLRAFRHGEVPVIAP